MERALREFLDVRAPIDVETVNWGDGIRLRRSAYVDAACPPAAVVTSVRAIVLRDDAVLVATDADGTRHIVPGGRIESGEDFETALRREIAEETGWGIRDLAPLGFLHFHHLTPKPEGYRYPYPAFAQVVFVAKATEPLPAAMLPDDYVAASSFVPVIEARCLDVSPAERAFLDAALVSCGGD